MILVVYSLGLGQGKTMTSASYNRYHNRFLIDCLLAVAVKVVTIVVIGEGEGERTNGCASS